MISEENKLVDYLTVEKAKVKKMIFHEFNEEKYAEGLKEEGREEGKVETTIKILRDDFNFTDEKIIKKLMDECGLSREEAEESLKKYWLIKKK